MHTEGKIPIFHDWLLLYHDYYGGQAEVEREATLSSSNDPASSGVPLIIRLLKQLSAAVKMSNWILAVRYL